MKILLSAYACEPNKGSEPEVGWQWAMNLAHHCEVTVVTRSNNRSPIERELKGYTEPHPKFVYIDCSPVARWIKKKFKPSVIGVSWYYSMWQRLAAKTIHQLNRKTRFDVIHHLTFASFRLPYAVTGHGVASIIGPVGGCEDFPDHLLPKKVVVVRMKEKFRNLMNRLHTEYGVGMSRFNSADLVLASTNDMARVFSDWNINSVVIPQIGMPDITPSIPPPVLHDTNNKFKLLYVGGLLYWKGIELGLQALKYMPEHVSLTLIGSGPDEKYLRQDVEKMGLGERVHFLGKKPRSEVLTSYQEFDLFLYPSLHDSGSFTVLEAMAEGLPVICLNRGGPAISVNDDCGKVIEVTTRKETCEAIAQAALRYIEQPKLLLMHGNNAKERIVNKYGWKQKTREMMQSYQKIISKKNIDEQRLDRFYNCNTKL